MVLAKLVSTLTVYFAILIIPSAQLVCLAMDSMVLACVLPVHLLTVQIVIPTIVFVFNVAVSMDLCLAVPALVRPVLIVTVWTAILIILFVCHVYHTMGL